MKDLELSETVTNQKVINNPFSFLCNIKYYQILSTSIDSVVLLQKSTHEKSSLPLICSNKGGERSTGTLVS